MKNFVILFLLVAFIFSSCATAHRKCDGGKKIQSEMW